MWFSVLFCFWLSQREQVSRAFGTQIPQLLERKLFFFKAGEGGCSVRLLRSQGWVGLGCTWKLVPAKMHAPLWTHFHLLWAQLSFTNGCHV